MKRSHILLFGTNAFGTGLLTPVLSLVFLSHGATMKTLSICIGIYAVMVVVLELPSGMLADLIGRKRIFLISAISMTAAYLLMLSGSHFYLLAASCVLQGAGRAFSSGSIEALEIEDYIKRHGAQSLESINSSMAVIESAGLALGSITGGILGFLDGTYGILLLAVTALQVFVLIMTACTVHEPKCEKSASSPQLQFMLQLRGMGNALKQSRSVATVVLMSAAVGMLLCTVEIYWQPTLQSFLPQHLGWIFGLITCLGYCGVSLGNQFSQRLINRRKDRLQNQAVWRLYWLFRFLFLFSAAALGAARRIWLFLLMFVLVYAFLGAGNLIENTFFHAAVANNQRASMMSLLSLASRAGGLGTSLLGSLIIAGLSVSAVWLLLPLSAAVLFGGIMIFFYKARGSL